MNHASIVMSSCMLCIGFYLDANRSIHRPEDPTLPQITVFWSDEPDGKKSILQSYYLEEWAVFGRYNKEFLDAHRLPEKISYRYSNQAEIQAEEPNPAAQSVESTESAAAPPPASESAANTQHSHEVDSKVLSDLIEECVEEIFKIYKKPKDKQFKHFKILKDRNFNYKMHAGLIILKCNDHPFVIKLFIDNPRSFTKPYSKGTETSFFFIMGGGMNRYLAGFTRISNLCALQEKIAADPYWSERLTLPRKWYWTPKNVRHFTVEGKNLGTKKEQSQSYPSVYAIVCDEIITEYQFNTFKSEDRETVRQIAQFCGNRIDPHIYNFFIEKGTGKIAIIDTEHFASIVGLKEPLSFESNFEWYCTLANRCLKNTLFKSKKTRKEIQQEPAPAALTI